MEGFLNRYRNITVLLLVIFAQLLLFAVQVKNDQDVRLIRVWTVSAVTPAARILEGLRGGGVGFIRNYITLHDTNTQNRRLLEENGRLKLENNFLRTEVSRADRAKALEMFQSRTPSKMIAATIIATGAGSNSKVVFVDRGSGAGVMRGMPVVTPDGIVGKVIAVYPTASQVVLITDPDFAAGVVSQKSQVRGTLKGDGTPVCRVDYIPLEDKVAPGEWFFTSGDDRIFPQGFPVGVIRAARPAGQYQEVLVEPSGLQQGLEDVLILIQGVHQEIPETPQANQPIYIAPPPPTATSQANGDPIVAPTGAGTEADKLRSAYKAAGDAQNHKFGEGEPGSKPPDFTKLPAPGAPPGGRAPASAPETPPGRPAVATPTQPDRAPREPANAPDPSRKQPASEPQPAARPPAPPAQPKNAEPVKKQPAPVSPVEMPSDAARRANQAAGAPKGPPH